MRMFLCVLTLMATIIAGGCAMAEQRFEIKSTADAPPRKVVIATIMQRFRGTLEQRLTLAEEVIALAGKEAAAKHPRLDLVVLPEFAISTENGPVKLKGEVQTRLGTAAKKLNAYVIVPTILQEEGGDDRISNAAILFDRSGNVMGMYRKANTVVDGQGKVEGGASPGTEYPVFNCDFGKLGIQICWDMAIDEGWDALGRKGAELVASPSASPATVRIAAHALRNQYWVITSTVRDNVTLFDPLGVIMAQNTTDRVMVCEIDLSYALLGWSEKLENGKGMTKVYGDKVGYAFSVREDGGVFWSNDPSKTIGEMCREFGQGEIPVDIAESQRWNDKIRGGKAK